MKSLFLKTIPLPLVALFLLAMTSLAFAHGTHEEKGGRLSQEQYAKKQQILAENYAVVGPVMQQLKAKRAELEAVVYGQNPDKNKIEALSNEIGQLHGKLQAERANLEIRLIQEGLPFWHGKRHGRGEGGCRGAGGFAGHPAE